ncbi:MAG: hypothetical protein IJO94_02100, partial [Firmicutes bacterium]|nr:hypothetical protein [Bacillota bacterium]
MKAKHSFSKVIAVVLALVMVFALSAGILGAAPTEFTHEKTGVSLFFTVLDDGTVALGNGTDSAIPAA